MKTLKEKQLEFLEETINHFNSGNRGVIDGRCSYLGGCAVGRHIPDKELCKELDSNPMSNNVSSHRVFSVLPESLKELGVGFLEYVQDLHDGEQNWNETGLTQEGEEFVEYIKNQFKL